jgi:CheY-like chemotaxis protein
VHGFIKQSGGHVAVYSELGVGTTVKLYLPRSASPAAPAGDPQQRANRAARKNVTILIIEDDRGVLEFASEAAAELGYDALVASTAAEAMALIDSHREISIVLTDVVMPQVNGRELAGRLQKLRADLKVIYMTGYTRNAIVHNGMLDVGTHLLTKPFTIEQLARALEIEADEVAAAAEARVVEVNDRIAQG